MDELVQRMGNKWKDECQGVMGIGKNGERQRRESGMIHRDEVAERLPIILAGITGDSWKKRRGPTLLLFFSKYAKNFRILYERSEERTKSGRSVK